MSSVCYWKDSMELKWLTKKISDGYYSALGLVVMDHGGGVKDHNYRDNQQYL